MQSSISIIDEARSAAVRLGRHPQDHGWRELYRLFGLAMESGSAAFLDMVLAFRRARPVDSYSHFFGLLGIAVKEVAPATLDALADHGTPVRDRVGLLATLLDGRHAEIQRILWCRQNSFTAARRFLVPQVLLGAYFAGGRPDTGVRFADLGTGLGVLPRQLNSKTVYDRFAPDLRWPGGVPAFTAIPLEARHGIDRGPMPGLDWVHSCYGSSPYYETLYGELLFTLRLPEVIAADVQYTELDLLDTEAVIALVRTHRLNAVNLCYVLYELDVGKRAEIVETLLEWLWPPGVVIVTEPVEELTQQGCTVRLHDQRGDAEPVCFVSDGHFRGHVVPLDGFAAFLERYPLRYE